MSNFICITFLISGLILSTSAQFCTQGSVRLVGSRLSGRVEVCNRGSWGTVCDDSFGSTDARVVCSQLGFSDQGARALYGGFGYIRALTSSSRSIFLDQVACSGTEDSLLDCSANPIGTHDCSHREDVGVRCRPSQLGEIRLRGRQTATSGRVEVFSGTTWGTVCDDFWSIADAQVACRQLGFSTLNARALVFGRGYTRLIGSTTVPIVLDDLRCTGSETRLVSCRHRGIGVHNCRHTEDAGLQCGATVVEQEKEALIEDTDKKAFEVQKEDMMQQEDATVADEDPTGKDMLADKASYEEVLSALKELLMEEK